MRHLPYRTMYVEPFAGMLGVLLQRRPSYVEVVNDLEGLAINWWTVVRDDPEELARRLYATPTWSRVLWGQALERCSIPGVEGAYWFTIRQLLTYSGKVRGPTLKRPWYTSTRTRMPANLADDLGKLSDRMRRVYFENIDAVEFLRNSASQEDAVVYIDPPYLGSGEMYTEEVDRTGLAEVILAQKGLVAISGFATEWDFLGWEKVVKPSHTQWNPARDSAGKVTNLQARTEALWMNYDYETECEGTVYRRGGGKR